MQQDSKGAESSAVNKVGAEPVWVGPALGILGTFKMLWNELVLSP